MQSQRLDDSNEGGGMMTGNEVVDGEMNNLFPDISRLDRTYGRVQLRKAFPAVMTDNKNPYYGAHIIFTKPAQDENVKCCMFTTKSSFDMRKDAVDRVEEYVVKSYRLFSYMLLGKHVEGAQALLVQQKLEDDLPATNSVLYIQEADGDGGEYIKIQKVEVKNEDKKANKRELVLSLWSPIQYEHKGFHYDERDRLVIDTYFFGTMVADAVHYFGIKKLKEPASQGDNNIKIEGIFHNLVPCAQSSSALSAQKAGENFGKFWATNKDEQTYTLVDADISSVDGVVTIHCPRPLFPGSVVVKDTTYGWNFTDDGNGNLQGQRSGTIDYDTGKIVLNSEFSHHYQVVATPAIKPQARRHTLSKKITLETQTATFAITLLPYPVAGSVKIQYRAQGNWYTLTDQGDGTIAGSSPSYGSGTIDYQTGALTVSLGALPDVNTEVLFSWGSNIHYLTKSEFTTQKPYIEITLQYPIKPGSLTITYLANGGTKTVTDNANGLLQGEGSGEINYPDKKIKLIPKYLPDIGTSINIEYTETQQTKSKELTITELTDNGDGTLTANLGGGFIEGTLMLSFLSGVPNFDYSGYQGEGTAYSKVYEYHESYDPLVYKIVLQDDGNGKFYGDPNSSIDYINGVVTFSKTFSRKTYKLTQDAGIKTGWVQAKKWTTKKKEQVEVEFSADVFSGDTNKFQFTYADASTTTTHAEEITTYQLKVEIKEIATETIIPGSLLFNFNGQMVVDVSGKLYARNNPATGEWGYEVGQFDYTGAVVVFSDWQSGDANTELVVEGGLFIPTDISTFDISFTTNASPIQVGSFQLLFQRIDTGEQVSVLADNSGEINGNGAYGHIDYQTGIVSVQFGEWVPDDANAQSQDWYDESRVLGGNVLKPIPVFAESIKYNAVAIEYVPLDPSILGLNPLRLPTDGRVPIFRKGDVIVIHNTQEYTLPDNLSAGQSISLPRGDLSYVDIFDQDGKYVDKRWYSVDLINGIITMSDPLDLSEYTQPLIAYHRREDMRLATDVQIDGTIKLIQPIEHDYDTDFTYVSSALLMGDLYASVYNVFDQKNWTGQWSDSLIGDPCTANYDLVHYPIETTNKGAIAERWAIIFTSSTEFKVVGGKVGEIATGSTSEDCAPINPATGAPYFTIRATGWGSGWATNNVLRFNTTAAHFPMWFVRTILIGDSTAEDDNFRIQIRGDAD